MATQSRSKSRGAAPKSVKAKPVDTKKRKALEEEEEPTAKPKKLKQAKVAESNNPEPAVETTPAAKPPKQKKTKKSQPVAEETVAEKEDAETAIGASESTPDLDNEEDEADDAEFQGLADELDSGDENEDEGIDKAIAQFETGQDVGKIPKVSSKKAAKGGDEKPGVVYVGRIPHGFYEHEMKQYFSQFGTITRLRLSRNKKTGASKHFAFIEFAEESTATIVAKTMDNYLLFGHILKCKVVPLERVHKDLWKGANRRFKKVPWGKMVGNQLARPMSQSGWERRVTREQKRRSLKADKLKEIGYEFEAPALKAIPPPTIEAPPAPEEDAADKVEAVEVEEKPAQIEEAKEEPAREAPVEKEDVEEPAKTRSATKAAKAKKAPKAKKGKAKA